MIDKIYVTYKYESYIRGTSYEYHQPMHGYNQSLCVYMYYCSWLWDDPSAVTHKLTQKASPAEEAARPLKLRYRAVPLLSNSGAQNSSIFLLQE